VNSAKRGNITPKAILSFCVGSFFAIPGGGGGDGGGGIEVWVGVDKLVVLLEMISNLVSFNSVF